MNCFGGLKLDISSDFDGGNIIVKSLDQADNIRLDIRRDNQSDFYQWFYFRLTGADGQTCAMHIENAGGAAYAGGWPDYRAVASYDQENWFRVDTDYGDGVLRIHHTPEQDEIYYAYFAPFSMTRHADLAARAKESGRVTHRVLGQTLDGQNMDLLEVSGNEDADFVCWVIARQHPGETMAEWWMEGFLERLLDEADEVTTALLDKCRIYVVPNMNPDGSKRGHLRTNACGANLNREWKEPSMEKSPEVYLVREEMHRTGVDFCLDVHGDEAMPYNFLIGAEAIPSLNARQTALNKRYQEILKGLCPDFQTKYGYPKGKPGSATLKICSDYVAETFGCLAMTLEMPFKDNADHPDPREGWSPGRSRALAKACLEALGRIAGDLRD